MDKKELLKQETEYDIPNIVKFSEKKLKNSLIKLAIYLLVVALSIILIVLYNSNLWVFIASVAALSFALILLVKVTNSIKKSSYSTASGEIVKVFKKITLHYPIKGSGIGVGITGKREYDNYNKEVTVITVYIKENEKVYSYKISDVTDRHVKYYEEFGEVIHIYGTRFPVKPDFKDNECLCPICGAFNDLNEKICDHCQNKILK